MMLSALFGLTLFAATNAQLRPFIPGCSFQVLGSNYRFDMREYYYQMADAQQDYTGTLEGSPFVFYLAMCGSTNTPGIACTNPDTAGAMCGYNTTSTPAEYVNTLALWPDGAAWTLLDPSNPNAGVRYQFNNGYFLDPSDPVTVTVEMPCDPTVDKIESEMVITETHTMDSFVVILAASNFSCPIPVPPIVPSITPSSTLSAGSVFLAIFFVGGFFYLVIGTLYKTMNMGTTGAESIPNIEFWRSLPDLVRDGCAATMARLRGGSSNYDTL